MKSNVSKNLKDFINHCDGGTNRPGVWFLNAIYNGDPAKMEKAFKRCLVTLNKINKTGIDKDSEFILIDRVFELNYRILEHYLQQRSKKDILNYLQKINYFVQAIICGDVKDLEKHYLLNKKI